MTPEERILRAQMGAHALHAHHDSKKLTAPARAEFNRRFELQVDPNGELPIEERLRRAEHARLAYFKGLALKSAVARRRRAALKSGSSKPVRLDAPSREVAP